MNTRSSNLRYDIDLPEDINNILAGDFWIFDPLGKGMIPESKDPLKFSASTSIYVRKGEGLADINLITHRVKAPCIVNIHRGQILQLKEVSDDFEAVITVMSKRFTDNLFVLLKDNRAYSVGCQKQVASVPPELVASFEDNVKLMQRISSDVGNSYAYQAQVLAISSFFFHTGMKCYLPYLEGNEHKNRITDSFMNLVQLNFRNERFLDFYSSQLGITSKHLSRTVKSMTGCSAVEWIERYVILEAKVMLKSTNLSIQQIADDLNFPSQSFFGKYFKKNVGMSPKDFRNT